MLVVLLLWASGTPYAYSTGNGLASGGKPKKNKGRFRNEKKILYRSSSAGCAPRRIRGDLTGRGGHKQVGRGGRTAHGVLGGIGNRFHFKFGREQPLAGYRCGSVPVGGIYAIVEQRNRVRAGGSGVVTNVD